MIRRGLAFPDWPERDRIAWSSAIADGDMFDGRGPAAHWAKTTRDAAIAAYGRWLGFLVETDSSVLAAHPVDRVTRECLTRYIEHLAQTAGTVGRHMFIAKLNYPRYVPG